MDKYKFKSFCASHHVKNADIAGLLDCSDSTLRRKVECDGFTIKEINTILKFLDMDLSEGLRFFYPGLKRDETTQNAKPVSDYYEEAGTSEKTEGLIRIENIFTTVDKDFLDAEDFMEMTGRSKDLAYRLIRQIKWVSDVFGASGLVHRVDYAAYIQYQLNNGVNTR